MKPQNAMDRMRTMPVPQLMLAMGIPMILSMAFQALYNIVDSAFVSNMASGGEAGLNALTLAFPVQMLMVAVAIGTGVGTNALLARSLGAGNLKKASRITGNAIFLGLIITGLCMLFGHFGVPTYIATQTANPQISEMAVSYLQICCVVSFGIVFFGIFEKLLQATGRSTYSTIAQITGAVVNIILDPIMIYGLFGIPATGIIGAAWATVIGQIASFLLALLFHLKHNKELKNNLQDLRPDWHILRQIYAIGLPAIISQALMSVMTYALNIIFVGISESVVTAYGLYYKIQQFILFAAFGLRDAITPIISFSHGMHNTTRVREGIKYGMLYTLAIMVLGLTILEIGAVPLSQVFGLSGETQDLCIQAIHIVSISFLFAGPNIAFQGVFQALDSGLESLIISVCRQCLFVIPLAWIFTHIVIANPQAVQLIWTVFPIAEFITLGIACILLKRK